MGGALVEGFLKSGKYSPAEITVADRSKAILDKFAGLGANTDADNANAVQGAEIVIVAVKPYLLKTVADKIRPALKEEQIIVSIAAGVTLAEIRGAFGNDNLNYFRAMPNIAAEYGASMSFISCESVPEEDCSKVLDMFKATGEAVQVDENLLDATMAITSCGIAYALRYIRAVMEASIELGLTAPLSRLIVSQTVKGAAELLLNSEMHPEEAIDKVTTPGGTTIAGLNELEHKGFSSAVISGHIAAYDKVKGK